MTDDTEPENASAALLKLMNEIPDGALDDLIRSVHAERSHWLNTHGVPDQVSYLAVILGPKEALARVREALKDAPEKPRPSLADKLDRAGIINLTASPVDIDDVIEAIVQAREERLGNQLLKAGELAPLLLRSLADARTQRDAYSTGLHEMATKIGRLRRLVRDAEQDDRTLTPEEINEILDRDKTPGGTS